MSEAVEVAQADRDALERMDDALGWLMDDERKVVLHALAAHRHEATRALMVEMPAIMIDPAGKGYPCMERPMTPAEAKWGLEDMDRRNIALSAQVEELREQITALAQIAAEQGRFELASLLNGIAKHKETGA